MFAVLFLKGGVGKASGAVPFKLLSSVTAVSANDIWAVGYSFSSGAEQLLIEHWNGVQWSIVSAPNPITGASSDVLNSVTEVSAHDVWAVGGFTDSNGNVQPLIEHWNGRQWSIVPSATPPVGFISGGLGGIEEVSANDIWAVGDFSRLTVKNSSTLIEHWNGKKWSIVVSPNAAGATFSFLNGITAVSSHNIWAVGAVLYPSNIEQPLIEHWNGKQWSIVASPNTGSNTDSLNGVAEVSAHNVWAVGSVSSALTEHWNGSTWNIVATPEPAGSVGSTRVGIAEVSAHDIWTVGSYMTVTGDVGTNHTLTEHWNGRTWSIVPSPNSGPNDNDSLFAVAEVSANDVWAVGALFSNSSSAGQSLIEHWDGVQWSIIPGPS